MGTTVVSVVSQLTGNVSLGVGMIAVLFVVGGVLFYMAVRTGSKEEQRHRISVPETEIS